jgi:hypothetical protein
VPGSAWYIVEKGIMTTTFTITIETRHTVKVATEVVEAEVDRRGVTLRFKLLDLELVIDPRYDTALLRRQGELVAVSNSVSYHGVVMSATDFAMFVKKSVKELIEEAVATIGL